MTCPICTKAPDAKYRPFCSRRCADIDLARWLTGRYAIPDESGDAEDEAKEDTETTPGRARSRAH